MAKKVRKKEYARIRADSAQHIRILAVMILLGIAAFAPVALRLYQLMITDYSYYSDLALRNQTRTTNVTAHRGTIYDRNMNVLAFSETVENVYLDPHELKQSKADLELIAETLSGILDVDKDRILKLGKDLTKRYQQIAANVEESVAAQVRLFINSNNISGIHLEPSSKRNYPYGTLASQVIGFTNASNTGSEGIEAAYNSYLEGTAGKVITTKGNNEMDMPYSYEKYVQAIPGCDVVLTLDATVQACLEKQMEDAIARYDVQNGAFGIVMEVKTGKVLAMATIGGYDPNHYLEIYDEDTSKEVEQLRLNYLALPEGSQAYENAKAAYQEARNAAQLKQWRNRVLSDGYEPGSTFKVMTMAAAQECGAIDLNTRFLCSR